MKKRPPLQSETVRLKVSSPPLRNAELRCERGSPSLRFGDRGWPEREGGWIEPRFSVRGVPQHDRPRRSVAKEFGDPWRA